jgi:hypothetical protein
LKHNSGEKSRISGSRWAKGLMEQVMRIWQTRGDWIYSYKDGGHSDKSERTVALKGRLGERNR